MSHRPERIDKTCLNCKTEVAGRFCQACGQENVEPKESAWHLVQHFIEDITHFDGKFFTSVGLLFRKPGFLSTQYVQGRRASYLNPIRMYVFTSALFFLIFFSAFDARELTQGVNDAPVTGSDSVGQKNEESAFKIRFKRYVPDRSDSLSASTRPDSIVSEEDRIQDYLGRVETVREYDSLQLLLPEDKRDGWLKRMFVRRSIRIDDQYSNKDEFLRELTDHFLHSLPYILFISLPLYALFLKLLYVRRKDFYYADHGIFLVHLYIFTFIFFLILIGLGKLQDVLDIPGTGFVSGILLLGGIYYAYRAMRDFYGQGAWKTLTKFLLFNILCFISVILLFILSLTITVFRL